MILLDTETPVLTTRWSLNVKINYDEYDSDSFACQ